MKRKIYYRELFKSSLILFTLTHFYLFFGLCDGKGAWIPMGISYIMVFSAIVLAGVNLLGTRFKVLRKYNKLVVFGKLLMKGGIGIVMIFGTIYFLGLDTGGKWWRPPSVLYSGNIAWVGFLMLLVAFFINGTLNGKLEKSKSN